jgi:hypothetical protein
MLRPLLSPRQGLAQGKQEQGARIWSQRDILYVTPSDNGSEIGYLLIWQTRPELTQHTDFQATFRQKSAVY